RCLAQPVSTTPSATPTIDRRIAIRTMRNLPSDAETERSRRSRTTTPHRINGWADRAQLMAVAADERKQAVEVERFLQEGVRVDGGRARRIERGKDDYRDVSNRRVGLLPAAELPAVHHRPHQVEEDYVRLGALIEVFEGFTAVRHRRRCEAF